jgi:hypothetical protein
LGFIENLDYQIVTGLVPTHARTLSDGPEPLLTPILSPPQWLHDPVNFPVIHTTFPAMMKTTSHPTMWLGQQPDKAIALHAY